MPPYCHPATKEKRLLRKSPEGVTIRIQTNSKMKSQEYAKFLADKKALIKIIFGQSDEVTKTEISLGATYVVDRQERKIIEFLNGLCTVCFVGDDGGFSYAPYKQVVVVKLLNNFSDNRPHDAHGFKEEVKVEHDSVEAIARRFPSGTATMMVLL